MNYFNTAICCSVFTLVGCATQSKNTGGLEETLSPNANGPPGTLVYRSPTLQKGQYKSLLVESAEVYRGADADFGKTSEEDKTRLAGEITTDFTNALTKRKYPLTHDTGPGVVRLHLTLAGVKGSQPVAATLLRLTPLGLTLSAAETAGDRSPVFVGSVTISGKLIDAQTGEVLAAFMATESPIALDVTSGLGSLRAAELGIARGADDFVDAMDRALNRPH